MLRLQVEMFNGCRCMSLPAGTLGECEAGGGRAAHPAQPAGRRHHASSSTSTQVVVVFTQQYTAAFVQVDVTSIAMMKVMRNSC